jgi:hypothetical protein
MYVSDRSDRSDDAPLFCLKEGLVDCSPAKTVDEKTGCRRLDASYLTTSTAEHDGKVGRRGMLPV